MVQSVAQYVFSRDEPCVRGSAEYGSHLRVVLPAVQQQLAHAVRGRGVAVGGREGTEEGVSQRGGGWAKNGKGPWGNGGVDGGGGRVVVAWGGDDEQEQRRTVSWWFDRPRTMRATAK